MSEQNEPNLMGPMTRWLLLRRGLGAATGLLGSGALMSSCGLRRNGPRPQPVPPFPICSLQVMPFLWAH